MAIETLDDIIEQLADRLGIYGLHDDRCFVKLCRSCWTSDIRSRIDAAIEAREKLGQ